MLLSVGLCEESRCFFSIVHVFVPALRIVTDTEYFCPVVITAGTLWLMNAAALPRTWTSTGTFSDGAPKKPVPLRNSRHCML